jgi:hypothetical protein
MLIILYLIFCLLIGIVGRRRRLGFFGFFLLSVLLTPVLTLGWLLITRRHFLAKEVAAGHVVICSECRAQEVRENSTQYQHCARCGAPVALPAPTA